MSVLGLFITKLVGKFYKDVTKVLIFISVIFYDFRREKDLDIIGDAYVYINSFLFSYDKIFLWFDSFSDVKTTFFFKP